MSKRKTWVKGYHKKDGTYVKGHWKNVNHNSDVNLFSGSSGFSNLPSPLSAKSNDIPATSQKPSRKDTLIEKYESELHEVERLIGQCSHLIQKGESYIENPQKIKKEIEKSKNIWKLISFLVLALSIFFSVNFFANHIQKTNIPFPKTTEMRDR